MKKKKKVIKKKLWYTPKYLILEIYPFETDLVVFIDMKEADIKKALKEVMGKKYSEFDEKQLDDWDTSTTDRGRMINVLGGFAVMLKVDKNQFRNFVGLLVHELTHVVQYTLRNRRIGLSLETEEIHTYLLDNLTVRILKDLY